MNPEEAEREKRIDRIFSPYAFDQMDKYIQAQADPTHVRFVHYTSADAALRIIQSKRVWMRNATSMSDFSEVQHGYTMLSKLFAGGDHNQMFTDALDACFPGTAREAREIFDSWRNDISLNTYIASIAEHPTSEDLHGRLSMWRAFGGSRNPVRVAIVVKVPMSVLDAGVFNLVFSPVAYLDDQQVAEQFLRAMVSIRESQNFLKSVGRDRVVRAAFNMLTAGVTCQKHKGFEEEREWRLVYAPSRWPCELIESSTETIAGVPQIVYKIPYDSSTKGVPAHFDLARLIDRIIIGPSTYPWSMVEAFAEALKNAGVTPLENRVFASTIPVRL